MNVVPPPTCARSSARNLASSPAKPSPHAYAAPRASLLFFASRRARESDASTRRASRREAPPFDGGARGASRSCSRVPPGIEPRTSPSPVPRRTELRRTEAAEPVPSFEPATANEAWLVVMSTAGRRRARLEDTGGSLGTAARSTAAAWRPALAARRASVSSPSASRRRGGRAGIGIVPDVSFGESGRTACRPTLDHEPVLSARTDSNARLRPRSPGGARRATARVRSGVARPTSGRQSRKRQLFTSVVMFRISRNRSPGRQRSSTPFWHGPGNWETPQRRRSPHPRARAPPVVGAQPRTHTRGSAPPRRRRWRASTVAPRASRCRMRIPF